MTQKTAIVTGASGAIAAPIIDAFAKAGWKLALVARSQTGVERLKNSRPDQLVLQADLADDAQARRAVSEAREGLGHIDALLNIAGGFDMSAAADTSPEQLDAQMAINFHTAFNASRAVLATMLERGEGFILGIGAAAAFDGGGQVGAYAASKAALTVWMKSMAAEVAPRGLCVSMLHPMGAVDTPSNREAMPDSDPQSWVDPAEIAATALHLATRGRRGQVPEAKVYPPAA
ncbi:SDR family oxidoreductase [Oleiagrimonas sp. C23AA]|uniref:SDR family NAD(P)-dependent oxidoreductase n=1 Tax=Oleiagrimonas sp. C23AA TaxID=2719047 RepID=UPI0014212177|nr:SDR family oxidoreductase [Oleiagrimonas sp. C23AA]NII11542.1 SDR family oxidoreductase [Oleiagrimonas sp. C23AA]